MYRIYLKDRLVSPSFYVTAGDAVHAVNGLSGLDPRDESDPPTTADEQAALLARDGYWHAGRGFLVREESPWTTRSPDSRRAQTSPK